MGRQELEYLLGSSPYAEYGYPSPYAGVVEGADAVVVGTAITGVDQLVKGYIKSLAAP